MPMSRLLVRMFLRLWIYSRLSPWTWGFAVSRHQSNEPDFEDGLIRACAEHVGVDYIISRDEAAFAKSPIKRLSPRQYLDEFCEVEDVELAENDGRE